MAQTDWALNARPRPPLTAVEDAHPASLRRLPPPPPSAPTRVQSGKGKRPVFSQGTEGRSPVPQ